MWRSIALGFLMLLVPVGLLCWHESSYKETLPQWAWTTIGLLAAFALVALWSWCFAKAWVDWNEKK